ncbi:hypothetical protein GW17_00014459, partial [Ensete ventricosum]
EVEATVVDGNGTETGHIIVTTIGGRNGQPKQTISYMAERVVGHGSFGVVFQVSLAVSLSARIVTYLVVIGESRFSPVYSFNQILYSCQIFHKRTPPEAVDLVSRLLQYSPNLRSTAVSWHSVNYCSQGFRNLGCLSKLLFMQLEALIHPFFDELRDPSTRLPNGRYLPPLFNFKPNGKSGMEQHFCITLFFCYPLFIHPCVLFKIMFLYCLFVIINRVKGCSDRDCIKIDSRARKKAMHLLRAVIC